MSIGTSGAAASGRSRTARSSSTGAGANPPPTAFSHPFPACSAARAARTTGAAGGRLFVSHEGRTAMRLDGKRALGTGAASAAGLGFATARRLARDGAKIMISDIDGASVAARAAELSAQGFDVAALRHDVTSEQDWASTIEQCVGRFGGLDIVVNNAG